MVYRVEAIDREARREGWEFEFDGERYILPNDFDMRAAVAITNGDAEGCLRLLLGEEQWHRLEDSPKVFGVKALRDMLQSYCDDIGVNLGEFEASSPSSPRTVTRSKRTSNGATA